MSGLPDAGTGSEPVRGRPWTQEPGVSSPDHLFTVGCHVGLVLRDVAVPLGMVRVDAPVSPGPGVSSASCTVVRMSV